MRAGDVLGGRFALERIAGEGGMGTVWYARDIEAEGAPVAVKVMREPGRGHGTAAARFAREAEALSRLSHPGIVRWLAHGQSGSGLPWLAMEWLEGEELATRLERQGLTTVEAVALLLHVAEAVAAAHVRGIVHRDIKPSNIFLVEGDLERVKLLDFGVARGAPLGRTVTGTGAAIGTPGYMAPEQVRGDQDVDARADVFALGCVLFECLTGRAPFVGTSPMAVLAKILCEEAPRPSELVDVPAEIDVLCARLLAKDPSERPLDAGAVGAALRALGTTEGSRRAPTRAVNEELGAREQRLVTVLLAEGEPLSVAATTAEWTVEEGPDLVAEIIERHRGRLDALADGTRVAVFEEPEVGAACALSVRALLPGRRLSLSSGRAEVGARVPVGEAIDRAARLLAAAEPGQVRLDALTARLVGERYEIEGSLLGAERRQTAERTLLGKATPCVGREMELGLLEAAVRACGDEGTARALVVMGAAGIGKSRLRHELLRRRGDGVEVWSAGGEPMGAGAALGLMARMVRAQAGIVAGEPLALGQAKLRQWVGRYVPASEANRVSELLCEAASAPTPAAQASPLLRSARGDPRIMADQVRRALTDLIEAATSSRTLLLVLEDLHWADAASVRLIDEALRLCAERPLMVLALGRPEMLERFPALFESRGAQHIKLAPLGRRAAERLVRAVVGAEAPAERVAPIVERAAGNAFFLEELTRAAVEGTDETPETVLAMLLGRIGRMEPEARRVLRAASVFGERFWRGGVRALCGEARSTVTDGWLEELARREIVYPRRTSRFASEEEYAFRHSLLREAAYGTLTDDDRVLAHRLAGAWLEHAGETGGAVLAEHFERGQEPAHARRWLLRAAEQASEASDYEGALAAVARGVALGAQGAELGHLRLLEALMEGWRGRWKAAEGAAREAMRLLPRDGAGWLRAAIPLAGAAVSLGHEALLLEVAEALLAHPGHGPAFAAGAARVAVPLFYAGHSDLALGLLERAEVEQGDDARARARVSDARAFKALEEGDAALYLSLQLTSFAAYEEEGDRRTACVSGSNVGYAYLELGCYADAERVLRETLARAERMELASLAALARNNLGPALVALGRVEEACRVEEAAIEAFRAQGDRRLEGASRVYLAQALLIAGDLDAAEREARASVTLLDAAPPILPHALGALAEVLLARGRAEDALATAREAVAVHEASSSLGVGDALVRLMLARSLDATGDHAAACAALAAARARLEERANKISDPALRESFLMHISEHARTLELARAWLDPSP